jgi:hypothetical protein
MSIFNQMTNQPSKTTPKNSDHWMVWITFFIAVSNWIVVALFYWQLDLVNKQLKDTRGSLDATKAQLRARISLRFDGDRLYYKNVGVTEAKRINTYRDVGIYEFPLLSIPKGNVALNPAVDDEKGTLVLQPGQEEFAVTPLAWLATDHNLAQLKNSDRRLYVSGKFMYDDIYHIRHYTRYCMWYELQSVNAAVAGAKLFGTYCRNFNDTD